MKISSRTGFGTIDRGCLPDQVLSRLGGGTFQFIFVYNHEFKKARKTFFSSFSVRFLEFAVGSSQRIVSFFLTAAQVFHSYYRSWACYPTPSFRDEEAAELAEVEVGTIPGKPSRVECQG